MILNYKLNVALNISFFIFSCLSQTTNRLAVNLSDQVETLTFKSNESPVESIRRFGIQHRLWSHERQKLLDHICNNFSVPCKGELSQNPSISNYVFTGEATQWSGHGAGSAGPDASNSVVKERLKTWHKQQKRRRTPLQVGNVIPLVRPSSIFWKDTEPRLVRSTLISGMELFVVDGAIPADISLEWELELEHAPFKRTESDTNVAGINEIKAWVSEFSIEKMLDSEIYWQMQQIVDQLFPFEYMTPNRIYCNSCHYGDIYFTHRDYLSDDQKHVSLIYYANAKWPHEWQGETIFYQHVDDTDATFAVTPRPGRVAVFRGAIPHRSAEPSRLCHGSRYTWVFKFTSNPIGKAEL